MQMEDIRRRARIMGIEIRRMKKGEIIRAIQLKEGCKPCFGTVKYECDELGCCFRSECLGTGKKGTC
jgi:hypothetical protein